MNYNYQVNFNEAVNIWKLDRVRVTPYESRPSVFDLDDRYRTIGLTSISMKEIAEIVYPVREQFLSEDAVSHIQPVDYEFENLYFPGANRKVDFSTFSHTPVIMSVYGRCFLYCDQEETLSFDITTCGALKLWVNGEEQVLFKSYERNVPNTTSVELKLKSGANEILIYANDLAERDVFFYYEMVSKNHKTLRCFVPIEEEQVDVDKAKSLLDSVSLSKDVYISEPIVLNYDASLLDEEAMIYCGPNRIPVCLSPDMSEVIIGDSGDVGDENFRITKAYDFPVEILVGNLPIKTNLFIAVMNGRLCHYEGADSIEERKNQAIEVAALEGNSDEICTALALLAYEGRCSEKCRTIIKSHLDYIEDRKDCADFRLPVILWIEQAYGHLLENDLVKRIQRVAIGFRYWCDEPGNDVMWFFSENHAFLFHVSQYLAGHRFSDQEFSNSGLMGIQQRAIGKARILRWFEEFLPRGYDEWNSLTYLPVDCIGFFVLHAMAPDQEIKQLAKSALDYTFEIIAANMHHSTYSSSCGRTYEHTLKGLQLGELAMYAWIAWGQGSVNVKNHAATVFATANYIPADHEDLRLLDSGQKLTIEKVQGSHNVYTYMHKCHDYALSSAMNYHAFETGLQQHLINLSFSDRELPIWVNQPGEMVFSGSNRPSYWAGSATLPYVEQYRNYLIAGFDMNESDEVKFVHVNIPLKNLEHWELKDKWLFIRHRGAYGAIYFDNGMTVTEYGANAYKEVISEGPRNAMVMSVGSAENYGHFDSFCHNFLSAAIECISPRMIDYRDTHIGNLRTEYGQGMFLNGEAVMRSATRETMVTGPEKKLVIFIDSGDTLVDESTEVYDDQGRIVLSADLRPGSVELIRQLKKEGYQVYMVADGMEQSFINVHKAHGLFDMFDGHIFSENVGVLKPHKAMFEKALEVAGLSHEDCGRVMMVGNNLRRDILGANRMNLISVYIRWSPRYEKEMRSSDEIPDYMIDEPLDLLPLVKEIEKRL